MIEVSSAIIDLEQCACMILFMTLILRKVTSKSKQTVLLKSHVILLAIELVRIILCRFAIANIVFALLFATVLGYCVYFNYIAGLGEKTIVFLLSSLLYFTVLFNSEDAGIFEISYIIIISIIMIIWKQIVFHEKIILKYLLLFMVFPFSQILLLLFAKYQEYEIIKRLTIWNQLGTIFGIIADMILMYTLLEQSNKEMLQQKVRDMEYQLELERMQKEAVSKKQEEMETQKQLYYQKLMEIKEALSTHDIERGKALIHKAHTSSTQKKYCQNAVINAVLINKGQECRQKGIRFDVDIVSDMDIQVEPMEICSLYSNLLDNAIHAVEKMKTEDGYIQMKSAVQGDYLTLVVMNSANAASQKQDKKREHFGHRIVTEIVKKHDGNWYAKWNKLDMTYEVAVSILIKERNEGVSNHVLLD